MKILLPMFVPLDDKQSGNSRRCRTHLQNIRDHVAEGRKMTFAWTLLHRGEWAGSES
jgi:hypothetical protein